MNNNQNEAKLKASVEDFIGPVLKHLKLVKEINVSENSQMVTTIDMIRTEVLKIKNRDSKLIGLFGKIERQIDSWIDHNEKWDEMKENTVMSILSDILCMLSPEKWHEMKENTMLSKKKKKQNTICEKAPDLPLEVTGSSSTSYQGSKLFEDFKDLKELDVRSILCLYSLGTFPKNTELEKRFVIYWWIGLGLLPRTSWKEAKMRGNEIYSSLKEKGFLESLHNRKKNQVINRCTINPTVHKWLLSPNMSNVILSFDQSEHSSSPFFGKWFNMRVHINLDKKYLNVDNVPINKELQVVHLGSWRCTEVKADNNANETRPKKPMSIDHIEIENPDILKNLSEKTTYLSLQGISGIEEIPESIGKLENLVILDLRSCHNLIKLPQQPRSTLRKKLSHRTRFQKLIRWALPRSWFNKLMVLDMSGCYLLDHMPKWISELCNLEVLKGFVVGKVGKNNESCQLGDLSKLINLKKLSIRTTIDMSPEVFSGFNSLNSLLILTITWGKYKIPDYFLPKNLEKLDIRCYPEDDVSKLMNCAELTKLKKLYIRGGDLTKIPSHENWKVEMLRLRFLKKLVSTDWEAVRGLFPNLNYVEYVGCPRPNKFPNDGSCWIKEKVDNNQNEAKLKASVEDFIGPLNIQKTPYIRKIEPFGSLRGSVQEMDPTGITRIVKISIYYSEVIDSLAICFERNGLTQCTNRWGGDGGNITEINLKTNEYIKTVKGFFNDDYNGYGVVMSLTLETNLAEYGPYGTEKGNEFKLCGPDYSQIIGFLAHCEKNINAIGVYVQSTGGSIIKKGGFWLDNMQETEMDSMDITRIVKIIIYHEDNINGLIVDFERNDTIQDTYRWGSNNFSRASMSEVNFETNEYIMSLNGHVQRDDGSDLICFVRSLVLKTNLRVYGPYGTRSPKDYWKPFEFSAPPGGQIIGFHGYYSNVFAHALGVYVRQSNGTIIKEGPFLGDGGIVKRMDPTCITRIVKIRIYHGDKINGLTVYFERNGTTQCTGLWGKNAGTLNEIKFKTNEYIKSVKGYQDSSILRSLILVTNLDVYGPYGTEEGRSFEHTSLPGQIISFFACVGINYVFRLGVYIQVPSAIISKSVLCGGSGGSARDVDDVSAIWYIDKVTIRYDNTIHALSVRYRLNDLSSKETPLWGGETGKLIEINFYRDEYIKSVRGYVGYFGGIFTVRSLELTTNKTSYRPYGKLITNRETYGPYGKEEGTPFELSAFDGKIIGFHGCSGEYLNAIGVYVQWIKAD